MFNAFKILVRLLHILFLRHYSDFVGFEDRVNYDIEFIGGFKNALFGKEGLFLATLTGPGIVYMQSLPISKLSERILSSARTNKGGNHDNLGGIVGGLFND